MADQEQGVTPNEQDEGQASEMQANELPSETQDSGNADSVAEVEQLRAALKRANAEAAERRVKLQEYERKEQERQEAELSETEKLQKKLAELEAANQQKAVEIVEARKRAAVERTAAKMRFHDPADAYALADLSIVTVDEAGKVEGVDDALKALAKSKPHLVRTEQAANLNANDRTTGKQAMTDEEAQRIGAIYGVRPEYVKKASR